MRSEGTIVEGILYSSSPRESSLRTSNEHAALRNPPNEATSLTKLHESAKGINSTDSYRSSRTAICRYQVVRKIGDKEMSTQFRHQEVK